MTSICIDAGGTPRGPTRHTHGTHACTSHVHGMRILTNVSKEAVNMETADCGFQCKHIRSICAGEVLARWLHRQPGAAGVRSLHEPHRFCATLFAAGGGGRPWRVHRAGRRTDRGAPQLATGADTALDHITSAPGQGLLCSRIDVSQRAIPSRADDPAAFRLLTDFASACVHGVSVVRQLRSTAQRSRLPLL